MQIEVKSTEVLTKNVTAKDTGAHYTFREQQGCYVNLNGEYRLIVVTLGPEQTPYAVGRYEVDDKSFFVGRFGGLGLRQQLVLRPVTARAAA